MSNQSNEYWSKEEREAMKKLYGEQTPPSELESRTLTALGQQGMLGGPIANRWPRRVTYVLGAAAIYVLGFFSPSVVGLFEKARPVSGEYLLLLHETPESMAASEADQVREYSRWARQLAAAGTLKSGEKLGETVSSLTGEGPSVTVNAGVGDVSGFFLLYAPTYEDAVAIANTCPHLKYGGTIELRPIDHAGG